MKKTTILAVLFASCLVATGETNNTSVTLSGQLHISPTRSFAPYYLLVSTVGGGTQSVNLKGKELEQFKEQIKKSKHKHVPVRLTGQFKTEFMGNTNPSPQPTLPGWLIWLEVKTVAKEEFIKRPRVIKEGANKPPAPVPLEAAPSASPSVR